MTPKLSCLKQQIFIVLLFVWVGNLGAGWLGPLAQGLSQATVEVLGEALMSF